MPCLPQSLCQGEVLFGVDVNELDTVLDFDGSRLKPVPIGTVLEKIGLVEEVEGVRKFQQRFHDLGVDSLEPRIEVNRFTVQLHEMGGPTDDGEGRFIVGCLCRNNTKSIANIAHAKRGRSKGLIVLIHQR